MISEKELNRLTDEINATEEVCNSSTYPFVIKDNEDNYLSYDANSDKVFFSSDTCINRIGYLTFISESDCDTFLTHFNIDPTTTKKRRIWFARDRYFWLRFYLCGCKAPIYFPCDNEHLNVRAPSWSERICIEILDSRPDYCNCGYKGHLFEAVDKQSVILDVMSKMEDFYNGGVVIQGDGSDSGYISTDSDDFNSNYAVGVNFSKSDLHFTGVSKCDCVMRSYTKFSYRNSLALIFKSRDDAEKFWVDNKEKILNDINSDMGRKISEDDIAIVNSYHFDSAELYLETTNLGMHDVYVYLTGDLHSLSDEDQYTVFDLNVLENFLDDLCNSKFIKGADSNYHGHLFEATDNYRYYLPTYDGYWIVHCNKDRVPKINCSDESNAAAAEISERYNSSGIIFTSEKEAYKYLKKLRTFFSGDENIKSNFFRVSKKFGVEGNPVRLPPLDLFNDGDVFEHAYLFNASLTAINDFIDKHENGYRGHLFEDTEKEKEFTTGQKNVAKMLDSYNITDYFRPTTNNGYYLDRDRDIVGYSSTTDDIVWDRHCPNSSNTRYIIFDSKETALKFVENNIQNRADRIQYKVRDLGYNPALKSDMLFLPVTFKSTKMYFMIKVDSESVLFLNSMKQGSKLIIGESGYIGHLFENNNRPYIENSAEEFLTPEACSNKLDLKEDTTQEVQDLVRKYSDSFIKKSGSELNRLFGCLSGKGGLGLGASGVKSKRGSQEPLLPLYFESPKDALLATERLGINDKISAYDASSMSEAGFIKIEIEGVKAYLLVTFETHGSVKDISEENSGSQVYLKDLKIIDSVDKNAILKFTDTSYKGHLFEDAENDYYNSVLEDIRQWVDDNSEYDNISKENYYVISPKGDSYSKSLGIAPNGNIKNLNVNDGGAWVNGIDYFMVRKDDAEEVLEDLKKTYRNDSLYLVPVWFSAYDPIVPASIPGLRSDKKVYFGKSNCLNHLISHFKKDNAEDSEVKDFIDSLHAGDIGKDEYKGHLFENNKQPYIASDTVNKEKIVVSEATHTNPEYLVSQNVRNRIINSIKGFISSIDEKEKNELLKGYTEADICDVVNDHLCKLETHSDHKFVSIWNESTFEGFAQKAPINASKCPVFGGATFLLDGNQEELIKEVFNIDHSALDVEDVNAQKNLYRMHLTYNGVDIYPYFTWDDYTCNTSEVLVKEEIQMIVGFLDSGLIDNKYSGHLFEDVNDEALYQEFLQYVDNNFIYNFADADFLYDIKDRDSNGYTIDKDGKLVAPLTGELFGEMVWLAFKTEKEALDFAKKHNLECNKATPQGHDGLRINIDGDEVYLQGLDIDRLRNPGFGNAARYLNIYRTLKDSGYLGKEAYKGHLFD